MAVAQPLFVFVRRPVVCFRCKCARYWAQIARGLDRACADVDVPKFTPSHGLVRREPICIYI